MLDINLTADMKTLPQALESFLLDAANKRCSIKAQGFLINDMVDAIARFTEKHVKRVAIEDITIGTVKGISMRQDNTARNISQMRIVLVKRDAVKE